jgi:integrase
MIGTYAESAESICTIWVAADDSARSAATPRSSRYSPQPGIRAGELAGIRYDPRDPRRSDVDLWRREITVRSKGSRARVVRIGHEAARALDRTSASGPGTRRRGGRSYGWG